MTRLIMSPPISASDKASAVKSIRCSSTSINLVGKKKQAHGQDDRQSKESGHMNNQQQGGGYMSPNSSPPKFSYHATPHILCCAVEGCASVHSLPFFVVHCP
jgi:hypothetical protein